MKNKQKYPIITNDDPCRTVYSEGMTLLDHFAAEAFNFIPTSWYRDNYNNLYKDYEKHLAKDAYKIANAMLKEKEKQEERKDDAIELLKWIRNPNEGIGSNSEFIFKINKKIDMLLK